MLLSLLVTLVAVHPASAGAPSAVVLPTQAIEGSVSVNLPPADALRQLADPAWVKSIDQSTTTLAVRAREGSCVVVDYTSPSAVMTVRYTVRQCPTGHGYLSTLVESEDFATYTAEWIVTAEGAGSLLTYRLGVTPRLPLPLSLITGTMRRGVQSMMESFAARFPPA